MSFQKPTPPTPFEAHLKLSESSLLQALDSDELLTSRLKASRISTPSLPSLIGQDQEAQTVTTLYLEAASRYLEAVKIGETQQQQLQLQGSGIVGRTSLLGNEVKKAKARVGEILDRVEQLKVGKILPAPRAEVEAFVTLPSAPTFRLS
jgi:hypothetical protein